MPHVPAKASPTCTTKLIPEETAETRQTDADEGADVDEDNEDVEESSSENEIDSDSNWEPSDEEADDTDKEEEVEEQYK